MSILIRAIYSLCDLIIWLLLARAILSWFMNPQNNPPNNTIYKIYMLIIQITEPIILPCRNLLSKYNTGAFDFSILLAMLIVSLIKQLIAIFIGILY